jgi:hypothetical protein
LKIFGRGNGVSDQLRLGEYQKELGLNRVEEAYNAWIVEARRFAVQECARNGSVSAVEVRVWAERTGNPPPKESAYSGIFRGKEWVSTGKRSKSKHAAGNARLVDRWEYVSTVY